MRKHHEKRLENAPKESIKNDAKITHLHNDLRISHTNETELIKQDEIAEKGLEEMRKGLEDINKELQKKKELEENYAKL